jgi:deazaflavin-dependent oxidoreductase (nitroreductase family)
MPQSDAVASIGAWMLENGHRALLAVTGGRWPRRLAGMQTLELHVIGRTSGQKRSTLLTAPICEDDRVVIVASKGGHSDHPQWYKNLVVNPDVEITINGETRAMRARTASSDERDELWEQITSRFRNYASYQASTDREIPVVVCEGR